MVKIENYSMVYSAKKLRQFERWKENSENARREFRNVDAKEVSVSRGLNDESLLYS